MKEACGTDDWFSHILESTPRDASFTVQHYGATAIFNTSSSPAHITHVSENLHDVCGINIDDVLHHSIHAISLDEKCVELEAEAKRKCSDQGDDIYSHAVVRLVSGKQMWMVMHSTSTSLVCEILPLANDRLKDPSFITGKIDELRTLLLSQGHNIFRTAQMAIDFINETLRFDRCVLYRFASSSGFDEVIAESIDAKTTNKLVSLLGVRNPSQNLTSDMKDLYKKIKVRVIAEVFDATSLIISRVDPTAQVAAEQLPQAQEFEDDAYLLVHSILRGMCVGYDERLVAMGIRNCMTSVIQVGDGLWGAIQCVNVGVRDYSWSHHLFLAEATALIGSFISLVLENMESQERYRIEQHCCHISRVQHQSNQCFVIQSLLESQPNLLELMQGDFGVAYFVGESYCRIGDCPLVSTLSQLAAHLSSDSDKTVAQDISGSIVRQRRILQGLRGVRWPKATEPLINQSLSHDWMAGANVRLCIWDTIPDGLSQLFQHSLSSCKISGLMAVIITDANRNGESAGLFFFRSKTSEADQATQTLTSSILQSSFVSDMVVRYVNDHPVQWSEGQLTIFHLLAALLCAHIRNHGADLDLARFSSTMTESLLMREGLLLSNGQAHVVFRKVTEMSQNLPVFRCVFTNSEFTSIIGTSVIWNSRSVDADQKDERNDHSIDLMKSLADVGLDLLTLCLDRGVVVQQQSIWSKLRGHLRVTARCRFLSGIQHNEQDDSLHCLSIRDDSLTCRVESALLYAHDQLSRSEKMKQELISTVSHELRTPLSAIMGFTELLEHELEQHNMTKQVRESLDSISTATEHLLDIVSNLLDLSRNEITSKKRSKVDLVTIVQEACRWVTRAAEQNKVQLKFQVLSTTPLSARAAPSSLGAASTLTAVTSSKMDQVHLRDPVMTVYGDPTGLKRVFVNLLDNAIRFSGADSVITVSIRWIPSLTAHSGGFINVIVQDEGIGIAPENLTNIFRPFYQVDLSSHREHSGVGLGLSIVKQLIELHKGRISVNSKVGEGTRFDIFLPTYTSQTPVQHSQSLSDHVQSPLQTSPYPLLGGTSFDQVALTRPIQSVESEMLPYITPPDIIGHNQASHCGSSRMAACSKSNARTVLPLRSNTTTCIMVVDDNHVNRRLLHRMLSNHGYSNVVEACNGHEALETVETLCQSNNDASSEQPLALMFLDIQMPVMDGPTTARVLRDRGFTFPIIAFSASDWQEKPGVSHFNGFLSKPITSQQLTRFLDQYCRLGSGESR